MNLIPRLLLALAVTVFCLPALAQESEEDEYKPELPDMQIYKAMLEANRFRPCAAGSPRCAIP